MGISYLGTLIVRPDIAKLLWILALSSLINSVHSFTAEADQAKLRIGYNENSSYPYFLGEGGKPATPPGVSIDILNKVASDLDFDIEYIRRPGRRILKELKENNLDAAFIFSYKLQREEFGVYPMKNGKPDGERRLAVLSYVLYKMADSKLEWDGENFLNLEGAIGANSGYSIVADLRKKGIKVEEARSPKNNFTKLKRGRIDGVADQGIVADAYLRKNNLDDIVKVSPPIATKDYFLIFSHEFSKSNPDLRDKIWQAIAENREELSEQFMPRYLEEYQFQPSTN
ncbi:ABC transporter substrate-binding protein [Kiloniella sp. EL199]|uniref:substrate-binding periplasmic protein n=1 Tax=Kiloniella sp. EL199 TaxID=2107581 RepID=UPI0013C4501D|nr:transporter substrate-binding domain-containing protein [Kiloniella sp. EL199]